MSLRFPSLPIKALFGVLATFGALQAAMADGNRRMVPLLPQYKQQCAACHTRADQGDFDEDNVRIPK